MRDLNLPWTVKRVDRKHIEAFPWLVLDKWGVVIGRFDFEEQARAAVDGANITQAALRRLS